MVDNAMVWWVFEGWSVSPFVGRCSGLFATDEPRNE